jgi:hypothetical protein
LTLRLDVGPKGLPRLHGRRIIDSEADSV